MHCDDFCEIFLPLSMPFNLPTLRSGWRPNFSSPSLPQVVSSICQNEGLYYPPSDPKREVTVQKVAPEEGGPKRRERLIAEEWLQRTWGNSCLLTDWAASILPKCYSFIICESVTQLCRRLKILSLAIWFLPVSACLSTQLNAEV